MLSRTQTPTSQPAGTRAHNQEFYCYTKISVLICYILKKAYAYRAHATCKKRQDPGFCLHMTDATSTNSSLYKSLTLWRECAYANVRSSAYANSRSSDAPVNISLSPNISICIEQNLFNCGSEE